MKDYTNGPAPGFLKLWWGKGALFPAVLVIFTVFLAVASFQSLKLGLAFDAEGVVVQAVSVERRTQKVRRDDRTETDYYVKFKYPADEAEHTVEKKVSKSLYDRLTPGAVRDVRYLESAPRRMEHTIGKTWRDGQVMRWISLAIGLGALGAFWWTARSAVEAIRARKFGSAEWATVQYIDTRTRQSKNSVETYYVLVWVDRAYRPGESFEAGSKARYAAYQSGDKIEVYRDSRGKTWWVGDVGPRATAATVPDAGKSSS